MPGAARTPAAVALVLVCAFAALRSHDQEQAHENLGKNLGSDVWAAKGECTPVAQKVFSP